MEERMETIIIEKDMETRHREIIIGYVREWEREQNIGILEHIRICRDMNRYLGKYNNVRGLGVL